MAKLLTLKESELINMVRTILEQVEMDLDKYDDNDFTDVFIFLFRKWIGINWVKILKNTLFLFC
jgi:hypothetical protein